ncbi:MAG: hypothetical protein D6808_07810, partial [Candidatus Dadabacteria bacterium]
MKGVNIKRVGIRAKLLVLTALIVVCLGGPLFLTWREVGGQNEILHAQKEAAANQGRVIKRQTSTFHSYQTANNALNALYSLQYWLINLALGWNEDYVENAETAKEDLEGYIKNLEGKGDIKTDELLSLVRRYYSR